MFDRLRFRYVVLWTLFFLAPATVEGDDWVQLKYDSRRSGNVPERNVATPLGLVAALPLSDAVFTAPVVAGGRVFAVDGSGTAFCFDAETLRPIWKRPTRGGAANCNNVSSPAVAGGYLHFGTVAGSYYVLDTADGSVVREIRTGEPIFGSPAVMGDRVYFATLGSRIYALKPDGTTVWSWDFVREQLGFGGDKFDAAAWLKHKEGRVTWRDQFCSAQDMAAHDGTLVVPCGGEVVFLRDAGETAELAGLGTVPNYKGSEPPATFGLSIGGDGAVYRQWHRRDNTGRVEILRLSGGDLQTDLVPGTQVRNDMPGLLSFASVSLRGEDVYRCRPEEGFGFCRHVPGSEEPQRLGGHPSIAPPVLTKEHGVFGGLDGRLYVVPLSGKGEPWSFRTAQGKPITAAPAVCDERVYFGCEDGYLYVLGPEGKAPLPGEDLELWRVRSPLTSERAGPENNWYTNYGDFGNRNANRQGIRPPFRLKWIRRYAGTFKHLPVCGGGRMYTHTAEGQVIAVEQETGRLLWRWYAPGVHVSYTSPLYFRAEPGGRERLLVPQAGLGRSMMRCFDAATGELLWEAPFSGSPSWSRQQPPVVYENLAIYMFSTGKYAPRGTGIYVFSGGPADPPPPGQPHVVSWLYSHDNPHYPKEHKPLVRAWDVETGKVAWERDFSEHGCGGDDAGLCLMDGTLYYSCFFGYAATRRGEPGPKGITAALDPKTGKTLWLSEKHSITAGCTISADGGRLYLGGYNAPDNKSGTRYVWCLDAKDGSLVWQSEPINKCTNVVTVGERYIFSHAYGSTTYLIDKATGRIAQDFRKGYACTRFTVSEPYMLFSNMDVIDTTAGCELVSTGPPIDIRECVGTVASNGRLFYTSQSSGIQASQVCGEEAEGFKAVWE